MKMFSFLFLSLLLISCGKDGSDGSNGTNETIVAGIGGSKTGIDFIDILPGLACANGGINIFTFADENSDGLFQERETILRVKAICNGFNGVDGVNGTSSSVVLENINSNFKCPQGGVKITSAGNEAVEICNGTNGLNGEQGISGEQGLPGMNGKDGSIVTPVKFCVSDTSTFPEYGLMIDGELFGVYWGTTPGSPASAQAFLTKLVAGHYRSTGGHNCLFKVN